MGRLESSSGIVCPGSKFFLLKHVKFWKQFFEASANVSLSGYEEIPAEDETVTDTTGQATPSSASSASYASPSQEGYTQASFTPTGSQRHETSSPFETPSQSTPRAQRTQPKMAPYSSPYEALKREMLGTTEPTEDVSTSDLPSTPRGQTMDDSTPQSSPFLPPSEAPQRTPANDVLLHRVLDKNYRILATPHGQPPLPKPKAQQPEPTPLTARRNASKSQANDDIDSSPLTAPQLRTEIFGTPGRSKRTPGISVLTPARHKTPKVAAEKGKQARAVWDSDSDEDDIFEGMSPPKTMQFHIPQSKLLKTPGKKALPFLENCQVY